MRARSNLTSSSAKAVLGRPKAVGGQGGASAEWWRLRPVGVLVAVIGLVITAMLTWAAFLADDRSSARLLSLQARQAASALSAALPGIESQLSDALTVAVDTKDPATFRLCLNRPGILGGSIPLKRGWSYACRQAREADAASVHRD